MKKLVVLVAVCFVAHICGAQKKWTLQECIDYALTNNITLLQNKISSAQREIDVESSKAGLLPNVNFNTNQSVSYRPYSESTTSLTNGSMTSTSALVNYNGNYGVSAAWTVWNGNRNRNNIKSSEMNKQLADLQVEQTANSIQEQITQMYIQILYQNEAIAVDSEIVKQALIQLDRGKEMYNVGSIAKVDVAQLEAQVTQDQYSLVRAKSMLENYKLQLKQLLEIHDNDDFDVAVPNVDDHNVLVSVPSKKYIYETALNTRPEIQSNKLNIDAARLEEKIAKSGYLPTVSMNASLSSSNSSGRGTNFGKQLKKNWSNSAGVTISVPIFFLLQTKSAVSKAKLNTKNSELGLLETQKKLYSVIENYWLDATTAQQQYISAKSNVASMQASYDLVSEQFKLGLKNIVELTTGKNNLLLARQQMLQSKYTALYNLSMLRFYEGQKIKL